MPVGKRGRRRLWMWAVVLMSSAVIGFFPASGKAKLLAKAKQAKMALEISQVAQALEVYRQQFGDYPPDSADEKAVKRHFAIAFPRYPGGLPEKYAKLDPASALVFWLGGMPGKDGKPNGFSANPNAPFDDNANRIGPFFEFDQKRLRMRDGVFEYMSPNDNKESEPYVYFRASPSGDYAGAWKNCKPCRDTRGDGWAKPRSFQIRCPGLDGKFGAGVKFPSGEDFDKAQQDDMSNFCDGTFGEEMQKIPKK
jgi:hypothetical protein